MFWNSVFVILQDTGLHVFWGLGGCTALTAMRSNPISMIPG